MTQQTEQGATPEGTAPRRPSRYAGQAGELTMLFELKPGGADRTREVLKERSTHLAQDLDAMGILHDERVVFFDNDTRMFFATVFDGSWDSYMEDFATKMAPALDALFAEVVDYPGAHDPNLKDYIANHQIEADEFYSAYPNATVKQLWKGQRVLKAWEELLDASEE